MKKLSILLFALLFAVAAYPAFLRNVPVELKQPDGSVIQCFITGDEFHRRVHDRDNYTIVQNPATGYYVYALKNGDKLVASEWVVRKSDPKRMGIEPNVDIPIWIMEEKRELTLKSAKVITQNPTKGDFNNIVISIRFSDQNPTSLSFLDYEKNFNSSTTLSLKTYYKEVSNSQFNVSSSFYPQPQNQAILEYQDSNPRAYYTEYNAIDNPLGYKVGEAYDREQNLIKNAIEYVANEILQSQVNFDINNDGYIDNLIFIIQGNGDSWGKILWPMSMSLSGSSIFIGNKEVNQYNKQLSTMLNVGVLCHEFFHALGAPDLYRYYNNDIDPVGSWDIMASSLPEHMTTFMKWKYGKWFDNIPEITKPGTYTLQPVSQSAYSCYKIPSPDSPTEYFIVEYRKKEGMLESTIPTDYDDGLIIYRINTIASWGNASGPPDEIYIYRAGGSTTINGELSKAAFSLNTGRTTFSSNTNPTCFLSDGSKGWIDISNIMSAGNNISFSVNPVSPLNKPRNITATTQGNQVLLKWTRPIKNNNVFQGYNVFLNDGNTSLNTTLIADTTFLTSIPAQDATYKVTAHYQEGVSDPVTCSYINSENPTAKDSLALVALYNQCDGPNWTRKAHWLTGQLKTWEGVTVENGRVVELNLGNYPSVGLVGAIPAELSNLDEIRKITLLNNKLSGSIPESWSSLSKLLEIDLEENKLTGNLPESWSSLVNLRFLNLNWNQLSGTLPASWGGLKNILDLWMKANQFSGSLPESWSSLDKLQTLHLAFNQLSGSLPGSWSTLLDLRYLDISSNKLTGHLPVNWSALSKMEILHLGYNNFSGPLPESWSTLKKLNYLHFYGSQLSGTLPESWATLESLETLDLQNNQLSGILPVSWCALSGKLSYLGLSWNKFSGSLPESWSSLVNLKTLSLSANQFTGNLPESWSSLVNLKVLLLWQNQFIGTIPNSWLSLINLNYIDIGSNQVTNLPNLSTLTNLTYLGVYENLLDFGDIEPNIDIIKGEFKYSPQSLVGKIETITKNQGQEFRISVTVGGTNNKFQWTKNGVTINGATGSEYVIPSVILEDAGIYTCQITNSVATQLMLTNQPITLQVMNETNTGTEILGMNGFEIYPNPTTGIVNLEISEGKGREMEVLVSNMIGGEVFRKEITDATKLQVNLSNQINGIYLLKVIIDNKQYINKVVLRKE